MEIAIPLAFMCLAILSFVIYIKSPSSLIARILKAFTAFLYAFIALGAYLTADYFFSIIIAITLIFVVVRRAKLTRKGVETSPQQTSQVSTVESLIKAKSHPIKASDDNKSNKNINLPSNRHPHTQSKKKPRIANVALKNISFSYTNSNGDFSYREVDVSKVDEDYIFGYCHMRRQLRTFRLDRIENEEVIVRESGEILNVYDWIVELYPLPGKEYGS
ncbi:WYL domain-containing protein [Jejubacter calystegiae]|uniref:WYL domain-containing protein n=1 Tax=Jejubacter calystegiae TaxID=2579935 RepID=A0A4P8YDI1_9ENTR|nr:WYL domain-containing protein [Jejubacter calystegiae]QCT18549.1 WYL domain-containing protein [Jejubacter calystegiae]